MGERDDYKSKKRYDKDRRKKRYNDDDDDHYQRRSNDRSREPKISTIERLLTPGRTANTVIKTAATGIIAGGTILLMGVYGIFGDRIAGANFLPMATAVSSAVATACVWIFGRPKREEAYNQELASIKKELKSYNTTLADLQLHNQDLEQRLANVELLESFEDRLAKRTLDKLNPTPPPISSNIPTNSEDSSLESSSYNKVAE